MIVSKVLHEMKLYDRRKLLCFLSSRDVPSTTTKSYGNKLSRRWLYEHNPMHSPWDYTDPNWSKKKSNYDPTAKRPNRLCDPYGQGGQPLPYDMAEKLRAHLHPDWIYDMPPVEIHIPPQMYNTGTSTSKTNAEASSTKSSTIISAIGNNTNNNDDSTNSDAVNSTTKTTYTSAEDVQRAILNFEQRRTQQMSTTTAIEQTSHTIRNKNNKNDTSTTSTSSTLYPMLTASEELQRTFASLPPAATTSMSSLQQQQQSTKQSNDDSSNNSNSASTDDSTTRSSSSSNRKEQTQLPPPLALIRSFQHPDYMSGTRFLHTIGAVAQLNAHYPTLVLERKIIHRQWYVVSIIKCHTLVLGGLSTFDFHLATMIDVEVERPEVQKNILSISSPTDQ